MKEFSVEIDDVRWYLAVKTAERLLTYKEDLRGLAREVWSGRLEGELYDMEESFLRDLQDRLDRNLTDEIHARTLFSEIRAARRLR